MTKKDFTSVSRTIAHSWKLINSSAAKSLSPEEQAAVRGAVKALIHNLADTFSLINQRFDYDKFYKACGLTE